MFVEHNLIKNIKIFTLAFTLTVVLIQLSRFISPLAIIHSSYIFLAWMPLCVMLSILFIFGWRGVVPVLCGMFCTNLWNFHLSFLQTAVMLGSQTFVVLCACAILRWQLGTRWRYGLTSRYVWQRLFWLGLVTPIGIKCSMYLVGSFFDFPLKISTFFGDADAIFTVVDLLSLFTAVLIYNMLFYYLTRMIVSPHFAQILWRRDIAPSLGKEKRAFTLSWLAEQSCAHHHVLALDSREEMVSGQTTKQVLLLNTIRTALDQGDLLLYAQPIRNKEGEGYDEILARLKYDGGIMTPDKFLPLIAQFNLSARFDLQVLESLLKWLATHPCDKKGPRFSVNLMPLTLLQKNIAGRIIRLFKRYHISPQAVILEITEEQAFSNAESSMYNIEQLHKFGFRIAIDDFGTGYANYERLKRLQADIIKIDGVFVKDIVTNTLDAMIVRSITDLAKAKSLSVVAEFVETQQQQALLHKLGVQYLQGYLIGRPQPLAD
ncbi:EAL domain-containing protein [Escherichia coli]|nr:EAL domain-containing protein [Escherichia coli]EIH5173008.1 EAL domain-containing protein [Escherichia coli]EIH5177895.1 EAL domain-containing protein [Escherichia coli]EIH5182881.1 EAL domain-containing protein [Escherichia coli]